MACRLSFPERLTQDKRQKSMKETLHYFMLSLELDRPRTCLLVTIRLACGDQP